MNLAVAGLRYRFWKFVTDSTLARVPVWLDNWLYAHRIRAFYALRNVQAQYGKLKVEA